MRLGIFFQLDLYNEMVFIINTCHVDSKDKNNKIKNISLLLVPNFCIQFKKKNLRSIQKTQFAQIMF